MPVFVLSPHPDDAVLSCWRLLSSPEDVRVVNVFTASPVTPEVAWWDRLTGASDGALRMRERLEEDRRALALAGRRAVDLGWLDGQYRDRPRPSARLAADIAAHLGEGARVLAPAGLGGVPDHELVRDAALELERQGCEVAFYADLPHAIRYGWPPSVTGRVATEGLDLDGYWAAALAPLGTLAREVHTLADDELTAKSVALRTYRTQFPALLALNSRLGDPATLRYEAVWRRCASRATQPNPASCASASA